MFGENGLITSTNRAKLEHQKAETREQIELALTDAFVEKNQNKEEYDENEFLDKFVEDRLQGVKIEEKEIELNGFIFELDRSVPKLGKYIGEATKPRIKEIKVIEKTTNSISIEVEAIRAEGGEYSYWIKKEEEGEESWKEVKGNNNTCVFNNLETNVVYSIKVRVEAKNGSAQGETSVITGELPEGTITFTEGEWVGDGTAKVTINTTAEGYILQYQIDGIEEGKWQSIGSGAEITGLGHGQTVYGRLYDGVNGTKDEASVEIKDEIAPTVTVEKGEVTTKSITVSVRSSDKEWGMPESITYSYYIKPSNGSYTTASYTGTNTSYTFNNLSQTTSYDVKVTTQDKAGNTGEGEAKGITTDTIGGAGEGLIEGNIVASNPTWSNNKASITLSTSTGLTIQYQVNGITEGSWKTGTSVTGLNHNDTVYARLTDGTNYGDYASVDVKDTVGPTVTVTKGAVTTKSITVSVSSSDGQWGMPASVIYSYYIKTSAGSYPAEASYTGTNTSYTFSGLSQTTSYDVKVTTQDKAGNTGEGEAKGVTTETIGGAGEGLIEGNIVASNPTWSNNKASITLSTSTGLTIQYQVNGITEGSWKTGTSVTGLNHNDTVYARLTDGINYGDYASVSIKDTIAPSIPTVNTNGYVSDTWTNNNITLTFNSIDNELGVWKYQWSPDGINIYDVSNPCTWTTDTRTGFYVRAVDYAGNYSGWGGGIILSKDSTPPTANMSTGAITENSIAVTVNASDGLSGISAYNYYLNGVFVVTGGNNYNYSGLSSGTNYTLRVDVIDKAGNTVTKTVTVSTIAKTVANTLKAGDYVTYPSPKGNLACRVLYDNSSGYGVQIITSDTVGEVTLGGNDFTTTMNSYNGIISTLNSAANAYNNNSYSTARCVGSVPNNPSQDSAGYISASYSYMIPYNNKYKKTDEYYITDYNKMENLGIRNINKVYWLASRMGGAASNLANFMGRTVYYDGELAQYTMAEIMASGSIRVIGNITNGLRPVFTLKSTIKVTGGNGTSSSPYTLGV